MIAIVVIKMYGRISLVGVTYPLNQFFFTESKRLLDFVSKTFMEFLMQDEILHPLTFLVSGNFGSGEATFANSIRFNISSQKPKCIVWNHKQYQKLYDNLIREGYPTKFIEGYRMKPPSAGFLIDGTQT